MQEEAITIKIEIKTVEKTFIMSLIIKSKLVCNLKRMKKMNETEAEAEEVTFLEAVQNHLLIVAPIVKVPSMVPIRNKKRNQMLSLSLSLRK